MKDDKTCFLLKTDEKELIRFEGKIISEKTKKTKEKKPSFLKP